jgi:hypothetical protein
VIDPLEDMRKRKKEKKDEELRLEEERRMREVSCKQEQMDGTSSHSTAM